MPRRARITVQKTTLKDGTVKYRPRYGREIVGKYVSDEEEAMANGYAWLGRSKNPAREQITVREWYVRWTDVQTGTYTSAKNRNEGTARHYRERTKLFVDEYGDMPLADVDRLFAREWSSANPARAREVRTMFADAFNDGVIPANPFAKLDVKGMAPKTRKKISPLTEAELHALGDVTAGAIDNQAFAPMFRNLILFAAYSGLRLGELSALRWDDLDFAASTIHVQRQWLSKERKLGPLKSRKPAETRLVVLFPQAVEALREIRDIYGTNFSEEHGEPLLIFTTARGARLNSRNHWHYWSPVRAMFLGSIGARRIAELRGDSQQALHFHDLRHFTASWLVNKGVTSRDAAEQLGHEDGGALIEALYGHTYNSEARARMLAAASA